MLKPTFLDTCKVRLAWWADDPKKWEITEALLRKASYSMYFRAIRNFLYENGYLTNAAERVVLDGKTHRGFPPVPRMYSVQHYEKTVTPIPEPPPPALVSTTVAAEDKKAIEEAMGRPILKEIPKLPFPGAAPLFTSKVKAGVGVTMPPEKDILEEVRVKLAALKSGFGTSAVPFVAGNIPAVPTPIPVKPENPFEKLRRSLLSQRGFYVETPHVQEAK